MPTSSSSPPPAARDCNGVALVPYFTLASRLGAPRCPGRKKLAAAKPVVFVAQPPPSLDLPIEAVIEFINAPDMVAAPTTVSHLTCCKRMFLVFQMFLRYVAGVSYGCCKSRPGCCICYKVFQRLVASFSEASCKRLFKIFHLFQTYVASIFDLDVAYVSYINCKSMFESFSYFSLMLQCVFIFEVASVLSDCCIYFTHML